MKNKNPNIEFYDNHADEYASQTFLMDMSEVIKEFLTYIPKGGTILDAGCGSGRDSLYFLQQGYQVMAFDASIKMTRIARKNTGLAVLNLRFQDMNYDKMFDGVWACASLLHIEKIELNSIFQRIFQSLKQDGIFFSSFKYGTGKLLTKGRSFTMVNEIDLKNILKANPGFELVKTWNNTTTLGRQSTNWYNIILRKRL
ncbi:MAG: class I SAM-dependent methyltransferase [Anaerolineaceae bacterium]